MTASTGRSAVVRAVIDLDLADFTGLPAGTARSDVIEVAGAPVAEAGGSSPERLRMTVHDIGPQRRLTAWYADGAEGAGGDVVVALERPIVPGDVEALLAREGHRPRGSRRLTAWPDRGLAVWFSARSTLPTILLAFPAMTPAQFDGSPLARRA